MGLRDAAMTMFAAHRKVVLCTVGIGLVSAALCVGFRYFRRPKKVRRVGLVSQINVFPLKSGKGLSVTTAQCLEMGLKYGELKDRHWLIVTDDGHQVTARQEPRLVLLSLTCQDGRLCLNAPGMEQLNIPLSQPQNQVINCRVWSSDIQGRDCGEPASLWITRYLSGDKTFRMVQFEPQMKGRRPVEKFPFFFKHEKVAYPDTAAILLMTESSVTDLNTRLMDKVTTAWFRPSIVVTDCDAYAEDSWDELQIGRVRLRRAMACSRCLLTTVNPDTGDISRKDPLETLKSYRMCDASEKHIYGSSPLFGQYYSVLKSGVLQVGDAVYTITN
ncbi:mitochondrial amidoxime-reducing component 1 [Paramormyrops kingsleyae]|uniref:Mitochondrial amidoxime reducing component 2 n=1 Tax=Paramormyrops kingsleyae TaxID=1676925 RepID=A0A3B3T605_9TELE|nr:mitochondrial amidoxime-reducing component 1-like [Paramormyrops kingsleyae]